MAGVTIPTKGVILSPDHVRRVLEGTPEPFEPASAEKRYGLAHFKPDVSLISRGPDRTERRWFNGKVLESAYPVHSLADNFMAAVDQESDLLLSRAGHGLTWGTS